MEGLGLARASGVRANVQGVNPSLHPLPSLPVPPSRPDPFHPVSYPCPAIPAIGAGLGRWAGARRGRGQGRPHRQGGWGWQGDGGGWQGGGGHPGGAASRGGGLGESVNALASACGLRFPPPLAVLPAPLPSLPYWLLLGSVYWARRRDLPLGYGLVWVCVVMGDFGRMLGRIPVWGFGVVCGGGWCWVVPERGAFRRHAALHPHIFHSKTFH